jgi:hypothetical protein
MINILFSIFLLIIGAICIVIPYTNYLNNRGIKRVITLFSYPFLFGYIVVIMIFVNMLLSRPYDSNAALFGFFACLLHFFALKSSKKPVW